MDKRILFEGPFLAMAERGGWQFATRTKGSGVVAIVATTPTGELLLVEQLRKPLNGPVIELPAGLTGDTDTHESVTTAANRELVEETGYHAHQLTLLGKPGPCSAGLSDETVQMILAGNQERVGPGGGADHDEEIIVHEIHPHHLLQWAREQEARGAFIDPKIYSALAFLAWAKKAPKRIAIYGGTFDPPHLGHRKVALAALSVADQVLVIPAKQSPHKANPPGEDHHRVEMLKLLFRNDLKCRIDTRELERAGLSYTQQTVMEIQQELPGSEIFLVIGEDQIPELETWKNLHNWKHEVTFLLARRGPAARLPSGIQFQILEAPGDEIASHRIRNHCASNSLIHEYVGQEVASYIQAQRLYGKPLE